MPDITKCSNSECPLSNSCYRFTCKASEYNQSYDRFEPITGFLNGTECDFYIDNKQDGTS